MTNKLEGHTSHKFDDELNCIHLMVVEMAGLVLDQTRRALDAFNGQDVEIANRVIERERQVNQYEIKIDDEVIDVTARRSPVAKDLRVVMSFCRSVTDLERIGDEAAKIAYVTKEIYDNDSSDPSKHMLKDVATMGDLVLELLEKSVNNLDVLDIESAKSIVNRHSVLDSEFQSSLRRLTTFIMEDARNVGHTISIILIIKALERIGDHAKDLAEYIVFLVEGKGISQTA